LLCSSPAPARWCSSGVRCSSRRHWRHDGGMAETETRAAFLIAGLVLLVMPIVYMMGLAAAMLMTQLTPLRDARGFLLAVAIVWGLVVLAGILIVAKRLSRSPRT
jgi:thiol:disulfide interchange protein